MVLFLSCPHRLVSMDLLVSCSPSLLYLSLCLSHISVFCLPFHVPLFVFHPCLPSRSCVPMFAYFHPSVKFACLCYFLFILIILSLSHYIQVSSFTSLCLICSRCVSQWSPPLYSSTCVYVIPVFPCPSSESLLINSCVSQFFFSLGYLLHFSLFCIFMFRLNKRLASCSPVSSELEPLFTSRDLQP